MHVRSQAARAELHQAAPAEYVYTCYMHAVVADSLNNVASSRSRSVASRAEHGVLLGTLTSSWQCSLGVLYG